MATRIYTRTGDAGETGLIGGARVPKDAARVEAYGSVDELNAALGVARAHGTTADLDAALLSIQQDLFALGADLATPAGHAKRRESPGVGSEHVSRLEALIDRYEDQVPTLTRFILPGGNPVAAALHVARCVCRRAERRCVALTHVAAGERADAINPDIVRYLNRLSDLLFVTARYANYSAGGAEMLWAPE